MTVSRGENVFPQEVEDWLPRNATGRVLERQLGERPGGAG